jgi:hypothetical protein
MKVQEEVYLIRRVHVSDCIQLFTNVANREKNVLRRKVVEDAIDEFDG